MKRFTEYLNEDFDPAVFNSDGGISIKDPSVLDAINSNLELSTGCDCRTPYIALEEIRKVLAYYKIFLPKSVFLDQNHGNDVFEVSQFGEKMGMNNQGEVVSASDSPLFVYFEWSLNEKGMYDVFTCLCNQEELDEILSDYESEVESDEELQEEHSMGSHSKMLYKLVNKMKSEKQSDDVDSYIEHEKQGKTFTQMNEEPMPDPKKKMGAKKVTLPNMMRKEETLNELRGKGSVSKDDMKDHIMKKHGEAWEKTRKKRKKNKSSGPTDTRDEDKHRDRLGKMYKKLGEEKQTYDNERAFKEVPAKETKTPTTSAYRTARKLARQAKKKAEAKKK
jgi:hypothetical protein